jgi:alpha-mannosidase
LEKRIGAGRSPQQKCEQSKSDLAKIKIDNNEVLACIMKPAEDGRAQIIRLFNPTGSKQEASVSFKGGSLQHVNILEEPTASAVNDRLTVKLNPIDVASIRLELR